jgi:hypothetical protein
VKEWWWSRLLVERGHRFERGEWRCADCRHRVVDLLAGYDQCQSPLNGAYVFVGGPYDGEWQSFFPDAPREWRLMLPMPPPTAADRTDGPTAREPATTVLYELQRHTAGAKTMLRYVFRG